MISCCVITRSKALSGREDVKRYIVTFLALTNGKGLKGSSNVDVKSKQGR